MREIAKARVTTRLAHAQKIVDEILVEQGYLPNIDLDSTDDDTEAAEDEICGLDCLDVDFRSFVEYQYSA